MSNETLIILGNGFDLDLGLNTSFRDFVRSFLFQTAPEVPLIKKIKIEEWSDLERELRDAILEYAESPTVSLLEDITYTWLVIQQRWARYISEITELKEINIKRDSYAYQLMQKTTDTSNWYSFNYTDPFYLCNISEQMQPTYLHGSFTPREYTQKSNLMFLIPKNLIIGIDSNVPLSIMNNKRIRHIIKIKHPEYKTTELSQSLKSSRNIILFGHSLAITDSDYFKEFFYSIINGELRKKRIFIITYDSCSLEKIKENMKEYSIDYYQLLRSDVEVIPIFTKSNTGYNDFKYILNLVSP